VSLGCMCRSVVDYVSSKVADNSDSLKSSKNLKILVILIVVFFMI